VRVSGTRDRREARPKCERRKGEVTTASAGNHVGSIVVAGGIVYVGDQNSNVKAFRVSGCGGVLCPPAWSFNTGDINGSGTTVAVFGSSIAVHYGKLYVGDANGLQAFDTKCHNYRTCAPLWTDSAAPLALPFIANDVVYATSGTTILAVNALSGATLWQAMMPGISAAGPMVADGEVYVALVDAGDVLAYGLPAPS
jgi:outer membrane protein assembly factor BamB